MPEASVEALLALRGVSREELEEFAVHLAMHELKGRDIGVRLLQNRTQCLHDAEAMITGGQEVIRHLH